MCFGWKKLVLLLFFSFFFKERINGNRRESIVGRGLQMHLRAIVGKTISMETRVRDTCCTPFLRHFFFIFLFVSSQLQLKFFLAPNVRDPSSKISPDQAHQASVRSSFPITSVQVRRNRLLIRYPIFILSNFREKRIL